MAFRLRLRKRPKAEIDTKVKEAADILGLAHLLTTSRSSYPVGSGSAWPWGGYCAR